jgi:multidrug transporter EmrE-like cation transporter
MQRWRSLSVLVLAVTAIYLYAFPAANIPYAIAVLLHTGLGVLAIIGLLLFLFRGLNQEPLLARFGLLFLFAGGVLGIVLIA